MQTRNDSSILYELAALINERNVKLQQAEVFEQKKMIASSWTADLLAAGRKKCARKLCEETTELAFAALVETQEAITSEAADVLYHLLVLLSACNVDLSHVLAELKKRQAISGKTEKANRNLTEEF